MSETQLVRYDAMCHAIQAAYDIDEVKDIRDKARAIEVYARQAKNTEAERQACEIRLRAERKAGQLNEEREKAKGAREPGTNRGTTPLHDVSASTLADLGISHKQSSDWAKLAAIPDDEFERDLKTMERPTTSGLIAAHAEPKQTPCDPRALWLWGRLLDFEREGLLMADPNVLTGTMLEHMQETTKRLAPSVCAWLGRIGNDS
jgi:hypothetical protein